MRREAPAAPLCRLWGFHHLAFSGLLQHNMAGAAEQGTGRDMFDFTAARLKMVDGQVRTVDVTDGNILTSMREVPRERFLPPELRELAYLDFDVPVSTPPPVRRLLQPMLLARLLQAAALREGERVLDVGCATGYAAALLTHMGATIVALEADADLAAQAGANLAALDIATVPIEIGPMDAGAPDRGPFDVILVEGAFDRRPERLCAQLSDKGRLVGVLEDGSAGTAMLYERAGSDITARSLFNASSTLLPGFAAQPHFSF